MDRTAQPRYTAPTVWSLDAEGVRDLLGPVETQYGTMAVGSSCLPLGTPSADTVQDNWQFQVPAGGARVRITVDVNTANAACPAVMDTSCAVAPDPARGPLDPKVAIYPPGTTPTPGAFNGFRSTADCAVAVTGDTGCVGPTRDATQDCLVCDNINCTEPGAGTGTCATFEVTLPTTGMWTIAVAPDPPNFIDQAQGCYTLTVEAQMGGMIGPLTLVNDDSTVTFFQAGNRR